MPTPPDGADYAYRPSQHIALRQHGYALFCVSDRFPPTPALRPYGSLVSMNGNQTNGNGNGATRIMWWVMGTIIAPAILAGTASLCHMVIDTSGRLNALERDTEHRLHQIEKKLDRLLEKR
jgi:hypothetical protein